MSKHLHELEVFFLRFGVIGVTMAMICLMFSLPVVAEGQGWSWRPLEVKESYNVGSEVDLSVSWGAELEAPCGAFELLGKRNFSEEENQFSLDYSQECGAWFFNLWGKIDDTDRWKLRQDGLKFQWENRHIFGGASLVGLQREPNDPGYRYGYEGWEAKTNWGLLTKNGTKFKMELDRKLRDYDRTNDSSDKRELESSLRWKAGHSQWYLQWREWTYDYPDNPMDNLWGTQGLLRWSHRFSRQQMKVTLTGTRRDLGDGLTEDQTKFEWGETFFFKKSTVNIKCYMNRQDGTSWIEEIYDLSQEQVEDWGIDTESGWGVNFSSRKEIGLHRLWKFGGYYHDNDGDDTWGVHTEWDIYVFGAWRLRLYLRQSGSEDEENPTSARITATYYF